MHTRRYDVDWLRVIALGLLIFYHTGMYYVADWQWHIKSPAPIDWLHNLMVMSNLWRMSLLFFVSGLTLALIEPRFNSCQLFRTRSLRLFIPLLFGMFVIVPPQLYYELLAQDTISSGYISFWLDYINPNTQLLTERHSIIGLLTWNHLWYLAYLWCYTLLFIAAKPLLRLLCKSQYFTQMDAKYFWLLTGLCLLCIWLFVRPLFPTTHDLLHDWYNHAKYLLVMFTGYAFGHRPDIWQRVIKARQVLLLIALSCYFLVALDRNGFFPWMAEAFQQYLFVRVVYGTVLIMNMWCWILSLTGYVGHYLNNPSKPLSYANEAVLPCYILHQSLIIILAMNLLPLALPTWLEALLIITGTIMFCLLSYELIKKVNLGRLLFGLKLNNDS